MQKIKGMASGKQSTHELLEPFHKMYENFARYSIVDVVTKSQTLAGNRLSFLSLTR